MSCPACLNHAPSNGCSSSISVSLISAGVNAGWQRSDWEFDPQSLMAKAVAGTPQTNGQMDGVPCTAPCTSILTATSYPSAPIPLYQAGENQEYGNVPFTTYLDTCVRAHSTPAVGISPHQPCLRWSMHAAGWNAASYPWRVGHVISRHLCTVLQGTTCPRSTGDSPARGRRADAPRDALSEPQAVYVGHMPRARMLKKPYRPSRLPPALSDLRRSH